MNTAWIEAFKKPDKKTITAWYYFALGGIIISALLPHVSFKHSVWITVPACIVAGTIFLSMKNKDKVQAAPLPEGAKNLEGIGVVKPAAPAGWQIDLAVADEDNNRVTIPMKIHAPADGPSPKQIDLLRELKSRYSKIRPTAVDKLRNHLVVSEKTPEVFRAMDLRSLAIDVCQDPSAHDFEINFKSKKDPGLHYAVAFKEWQAIEVFGVF